MSERLKKVFCIPKGLYVVGSPVIIEQSILYKDTVSGDIVFQGKYENVSSKRIKACKIKIDAFELDGQPTQGIEEYSYLDINAVSGAFFGVKTPVIMPNNNTRKINVTITKIIFDDDTNWIYDNETPWQELSNRISLKEYFRDTQVEEQFYLENSNEMKYYPFKEMGVFRCSCGGNSLLECNKCLRCKNSIEDIEKSIDKVKLRDNYNARVEEETIKARNRKENKEKLIKKLKRIVVVFVAVLVVALSIGGLIYHFNKESIDNYFSYIEGLRQLSNGEYEEAEDTFEKLGDYKDSSDKWKEAIYYKGNELYEAEDYSGAILCFKRINEYEDSSEKITDCKYEMAEAARIDEDYITAYKIFSDLENYKDSDEKALDCAYDYILDHYDMRNAYTKIYIKKLIQANYPEAQSLYEDLMRLRVEITAINDNEYSSEDKYSVSNDGSVYFHFEITSGEEDKNYKLKVEITLPGCDPDISYIDAKLDEEWYVWYDLHGDISGNASIYIYDENENWLDCDNVQIY